MPTIPTDSVLRRHYEQQQGRSGAGQPAPAASAPAQPAPLPDAASGGLFGWLKKLFGG